MKLWEDIRNYFYRKAIQRKLEGQSTKRVLTNLDDAETIGILYDSTNPDNDIIITRFAEQLRNDGKTVEILGFINDKKIDHKADIAVFNKKAISWAQVPQDERVEKFAAKDFDLLFAAFTNVSLPLEYVARIAKAKWRVGVYDDRKTDYYEMMIKMGDKTEVQYFIDQATHFLNKIHYDTKQA
ncbi:MAG: hypothetical protein RLZZ367_1403 [Bacteroidota bacterium]|jgi:hypothetical protein